MYEDRNAIRLVIHNSIQDGKEDLTTDASVYLQNILSRLSSLGYHNTKVSINIKILDDDLDKLSKVSIDSNDFDRSTNYQYYHGDMKNILQFVKSQSYIEMSYSDLVAFGLKLDGLLIHHNNNIDTDQTDMNILLNDIFHDLHVPYKVITVGSLNKNDRSSRDYKYQIQYWPMNSESFISDQQLIW